MDITLCCLAGNEEHCLARCLLPLVGHFQEAILMDDYSTDQTAPLAAAVWPNIRILRPSRPVYQSGFGEAATEMIRAAQQPWIFILDADESVDGIEGLDPLTRHTDVAAWALPRRKWEPGPRGRRRVEFEAYPDWQVRLVKNAPGIGFIGQMHVRFTGSGIRHSYRGPTIDHHQAEYRLPDKLQHRQSLYPALAAQQGVAVQGGQVLPRC